MAQIFYVDVPIEETLERWKNVRTFKTLGETIQFCRENFGADQEGKISLVTEGDDGELELDEVAQR